MQLGLISKGEIRTQAASTVFEKNRGNRTRNRAVINDSFREFTERVVNMTVRSRVRVINRAVNSSSARVSDDDDDDEMRKELME